MLFLKILVIIGVAVTVLIMLKGVASMGKVTKDNKNKSNIMMRYRVISQLITLALVLLYLYLNDGAF